MELEDVWALEPRIGSQSPSSVQLPLFHCLAPEPLAGALRSNRSFLLRRAWARALLSGFRGGRAVLLWRSAGYLSPKL